MTTKTFLNKRTGLAITIAPNTENLIQKLADWLHAHEEIVDDIEPHEELNHTVWIDEDTITFCGDNGIFTLDLVVSTLID